MINSLTGNELSLEEKCLVSRGCCGNCKETQRNICSVLFCLGVKRERGYPDPKRPVPTISRLTLWLRNVAEFYNKTSVHLNPFYGLHNIYKLQNKFELSSKFTWIFS